MSQQELLRIITRALEGIGIPYMVTGSFVSSLQGEPRATHDIDIVITINPSQTDKMFQAFSPSEFYINLQSIVHAINQKGMFNIIHSREGLKIDFWILTDSPFDQSRFSRRYPEDFREMRIYVSRAEDTILAKLRWAKVSGGSEKQFFDALRVYEVQYGNLDLNYLEKWVIELDLDSLWSRLIKEAHTI